MGPGQCQCQQVSEHCTVFDFYKIFVTGMRMMEADNLK